MATYRNRRGGVVVSSLSDAEAYRLLATSNDTFHLSLAKGYRKFGRFTAEQLYWAHKGALELQRTQLPAPVPVHRPAVQNGPASVRLPQSAGTSPTAPTADNLESMLQGHPPEVLRFMARLAQTAGISLPIPEQDQPQCAKNWGLPYGLAAADPAAVAAKNGKGKSKTSATK